MDGWMGWFEDLRIWRRGKGGVLYSIFVVGACMYVYMYVYPNHKKTPLHLW